MVQTKCAKWIFQQDHSPRRLNRVKVMHIKQSLRSWRSVSGFLFLLVAGLALLAQDQRERLSRTTFFHALPALNGKNLSISLVEVSYGPGAASPAHSHSCPVIGYVLQGAIRSQVKGETAAVYQTGESFYEAPNQVHLVSANASSSQPAKLLAIFVCERNASMNSSVQGRQ